MSKRFWSNIVLGMGGAIMNFYSLSAQQHNGELYQQLIQGFFEKNGDSFAQIDGQYVQAFMPAFQVDSAAISSLSFSDPEVRYIFLKNKIIRRELSIPLVKQDSVSVSKVLSIRDTLSREDALWVFKNSPKELKGDKPSLSARFVKPVLVIAASIGALLTLFYIRSS